jgi:hypothetical protein
MWVCNQKFNNAIAIKKELTKNWELDATWCKHGQLSGRNAERSCASSLAQVLQQHFEVIFEAMATQNQL